MKHTRTVRGTEVLRCGAQMPSVRLRGQRADNDDSLSCTRVGGYWALCPTASQFIATSFRAASFSSLLLFDEASA